MTTSITLPKWIDLHTHLRQDELLPHTISDHLKAGCAGVLAMPNTKPPITNLEMIETYIEQIRQNGGDKFEHIIVPLYLSKDTTPEMFTSGKIKAAKYYPPNATTGAEYSCSIETLIENGILTAMESNNVVLCIHGEMHDLTPENYFAKNTNAEEAFYQMVMPKIRSQFPNLKIVCEHVTTKVAVDFVKANPDNTAATITPQHLIYTIGDLLKGLKYHLYCLPLLKFEEDRTALQNAVIDPNNSQFFAGTDSAPHTHKATECGCAAGCYTAPIGPQLYAQAFERSGIDLSQESGQTIFKKFLSELGPKFYGLPVSTDTFTLEKTQTTIDNTKTPNGSLVPLPLGLGLASLDWKIASPIM